MQVDVSQCIFTLIIMKGLRHSIYSRGLETERAPNIQCKQSDASQKYVAHMRHFIQ